MSHAAGHAIDPAPLELREHQLLQAARTGEPNALAALWDGCVDELWSITAALLGREPALELLGTLRAQIRDRAPGLSVDRSFRLQALALLWTALRGDDTLGTLSDAIQAPPPEPAQTVAQGLSALPIELRWVYVLAFLGGLHSAQIAALCDSDEDTVRALRARAAWALVASTRGTP